MNKSSAIIMALLAFVGGLFVGNITAGKFGGGEDEVGEEGTVAADEENVERFKIPVDSRQPAKGPKDALITIVEFSDFECPFCMRVNPTISRIMNEYKGKVRVVWRNNPLPFHKNAMPAAIASVEAFKQGGDKMFWKMHDILFQNNRALGEENLIRYGKEAGLDTSKLKAALSANKHESLVKADLAVATQFGVRGTPNFFINGRNVRGAVPFDQFKTVIDEELAKANELVKSGVKPAQLYAEVTKNARTSPAAPAAAAQQARPGRPDPSAVYKVPVGDSPVKGASDALVTIIEFSEFQCPFCSKVTPTIKQVMDTYKKDVRVVFKHNPLPFHKNAMPAAEAAVEVYKQLGSEGFWAYHDVLFKNQSQLEQPSLEQYAQALSVGGKKVNMGRFKSALSSGTHKAAVTADQAVAQKFGASGTPAFFINGRFLSGAQPFENFKSLIDEELKKAKAKVSAGVPKARIYDEVTKGGQSEVTAAPAPSAQQQPDENKIYKIAVPRGAPEKGPKNAPVTIQIFSDFQCPFCNKVEPTLDQLTKEYSNKVRLIWRDYPLPFHQNAMPAAEAAREVFAQGGSAKFWKYHDLLFKNQSALSRADLEKYAQQVGGINMGAFKAALDSNKHRKGVQDDMNAVRDAGAQIGTPAFFINGKLLQGARPYESFKQAVDEALRGK